MPSDCARSDFLQAMAYRYCWDSPDPMIVAENRIVRRVMDLGLLDDALALEPTLGRARLIEILTTTSAGGMRPKSWWFWHYRLGLADAAHDPPPMPSRKTSE